MKKVLGALVFGLIEVFSYFALNVQNLDSFFTIWTFLSIAIALYIFIGSPRNMQGGYGIGSFSVGIENLLAEKMGKSVGNQNKRHKKVFTNLLSYIAPIIYCLINIVGLIITL